MVTHARPRRPTVEDRLNGELLDATRTPARKRTFEGETTWIITAGVPVIGTLQEGVHTLEYAIDFDGDVFVASVLLDVSSTHF